MFLSFQQNHHIVRICLAELGKSLPVLIFDQPMCDHMGRPQGCTPYCETDNEAQAHTGPGLQLGLFNTY